jgi:uncharacterized protein (DUF427 family)
VKATWNGTVIAESADTVVVEGNHYFPADSLNDQAPKAAAAEIAGRVAFWRGVQVS